MELSLVIIPSTPVCHNDNFARERSFIWCRSLLEFEHELRCYHPISYIESV